MADEKITQYDIGYMDVLCTGVKWRYPEKNIFYFTKDGKDYEFEQRYYIDSQSDTDHIRDVIVNQFLPWWKNERIKELEPRTTMNKPKILMPIHPQWCEKIFNGEKTIEVRKTAPKLETPFEVLVYQTKHKHGKSIINEVLNSVYGGGKVIGSFVCDGIEECVPDYDPYTETFFNYYFEGGDDCLTAKEIRTYGKGDPLYGWHITEPKLFDKPRELSEFGTVCNRHGSYDECGDCSYLREAKGAYLYGYDVDTWCGVGNIKPLTRAPQSWCYVERYDAE